MKAKNAKKLRPCCLMMLLSALPMPWNVDAGTITDVFAVPTQGIGVVTDLSGNRLQSVLGGFARESGSAPIRGASDRSFVARFSGLQPMDFIFSVRDSARLGRDHTFEFIFNDSGRNWNGFRQELGFGFRTQTIDTFRSSTPGDGLAFALLPIPRNVDPPLGAAQIQELRLQQQLGDKLTWGGGNIPSVPAGGGPALNDQTNFSFSLNIPDASSAIPEEARQPRGYFFTLRQTPVASLEAFTAPEPSMLFLFGSGLAGLAGIRRLWMKT